MDIEKLIERLEAWNEQHLSVVCGNGHFACDYLCENEDCIVVRAATALSTLQAENEKLRAELEQERAHRIHAEQHADAFLKDCERLNAQLERVTAERDAAVSDLETIMAYNSDTCQFCKNGQCYVRGGTKSCLPKWRGQKEE